MTLIVEPPITECDTPQFMPPGRWYWDPAVRADGDEHQPYLVWGDDGQLIALVIDPADAAEIVGNHNAIWCTPPQSVAAAAPSGVCENCGGIGVVESYMTGDMLECQHCRGTGFMYGMKG
jgi:hypothetical protein